MDTQIEALRQQQKDLRSQRDRIRKDLKNAQKRRSRLKKKASRLSNGDLFDLIALRGAVLSFGMGSDGVLGHNARQDEDAPREISLQIDVNVMNLEPL